MVVNVDRFIFVFDNTRKEIGAYHQGTTHHASLYSMTDSTNSTNRMLRNTGLCSDALRIPSLQSGEAAVVQWWSRRVNNNKKKQRKDTQTFIHVDKVGWMDPG